MGAWGVGIFSNDDAADAKKAFGDLIRGGLTASEATDIILEEYCFGDPHDLDNNPVWLGLAATQRRLGHIVPSVIARAIEITQSQDELDRWSDDDRKARQRALEKLKLNLLESPPEPRKYKPVKRRETALPIGSHYLFIDQSTESQLLLRVLGRYIDGKGSYPVFGVLDWDGSEHVLEAPQYAEQLRHQKPLLEHRPFVTASTIREEVDKDHLKPLPGTYPRNQITVTKTGGYSLVSWSGLVDHVKKERSVLPATIR